MYTLITPELIEAHRQDLMDMASPARRGDHAPATRRSPLARALARLTR